MEDSEACNEAPQTRVRKTNSFLQDEPQYRFDEKGFKVPIEPVLTSVASKAKKPPLAPKKTAAAPVPAPAAPEVVAIAARPLVLDPPDGTIAVEEEAKKAKRTQIQWNEQRDELLLDKITQHNALEKGKMGERFQLIADDLFNLDAFKNFSLVKGDTFQKRYSEMKRDVSNRWALDKESANLSGLPEFNSSALKGWERKIYTIILREEKSSKGKAITSLHGLNKEISMLTHEKNGIKRQLLGMKYLPVGSTQIREVREEDLEPVCECGEKGESDDEEGE